MSGNRIDQTTSPFSAPGTVNISLSSLRLHEDSVQSRHDAVVDALSIFTSYLKSMSQENNEEAVRQRGEAARQAEEATILARASERRYQELLSNMTIAISTITASLVGLASALTVPVLPSKESSDASTQHASQNEEDVNTAEPTTDRTAKPIPIVESGMNQGDREQTTQHTPSNLNVLPNKQEYPTRIQSLARSGREESTMTTDITQDILPSRKLGGTATTELLPRCTSDGVNARENDSRKNSDVQASRCFEDKPESSFHSVMLEPVFGVAEDIILQIEDLDLNFTDKDAEDNQRAEEEYPEPVYYNGDGDPYSFEKSCHNIFERLVVSKSNTIRGRMAITQASFSEHGRKWFESKQKLLSRQPGQARVLPSTVLRSMRDTLDPILVRAYKGEFFNFKQGSLAASDYILTMYELAGRTGIEIPTEIFKNRIVAGLNKRIFDKLIEFHLEDVEDVEILTQRIIDFDSTTWDRRQSRAN